MVDTVTLVAASAVGLAVDGETIPYVSGWGERGALEAVTEFAETIDKVARRIEDVLVAANEETVTRLIAACRRAHRPERFCPASSSRLISRTASSSCHASASVSSSSTTFACSRSRWARSWSDGS